MSSEPSFNAPVLNYVGSVDVSTSTSGSTLYTILFDSSLCTVGNVLMFEYKIQAADIEWVGSNNVHLGYINVENAIFTSGIANQWTISVPAYDHIYNPNTQQNISVRVYSGLTNSPEIAVTPWSNELAVHVPPAQPIINRAFFAQNNLSVDDLFVNMVRYDSSYNYSEIKFIAAYHFTDENGNTVWAVSDPLTANNVTDGSVPCKQLIIPDIGHVTSVYGDYTDEVFVAVYAVYEFTDSGKKYYSVSQVSETAIADDANQFSAPTITDISYNVYNSVSVPGDQRMFVKWNAPANSSVPGFGVYQYVTQKSLNGGSTWTTISTDPSNVFQHEVDVSTYGCGDTLSFRVIAVIDTTGHPESPPSNVESKAIFKYSTAPLNLTVTDISSDSNGIDITISFSEPSNTNCGVPKQYVITYPDGHNETVTYTSGTISVARTNMNIPTSGEITVVLKTEDTNSPHNNLAGLPATVSYIVSNLNLDPIEYQVYNNGSQDMDLTWNNVVSGQVGWNASYEIFLSVDGGAYTSVHTTSTTIYTYDATGHVCGVTLTFKVVATLTNGVETYTVESTNTESINIFKYPEGLGNSAVLVNWASSNQNETIVDLLVTITVPGNYNPGCGSNPTWILEVLNSNNNSLVTPKQVPYINGQTTYLAYINNAAYVTNGNVVVYLQTQDTNGHGDIEGPSVSEAFTSSGLPIIQNVVVSGGVSGRMQLTFDVYSQVALAQHGKFLWANPSLGAGNIVQSQEFLTNSVQPSTLENNVLKYSYTFANTYFTTSPLPIPANLVIAVANAVGISTQNNV